METCKKVPKSLFSPFNNLQMSHLYGKISPKNAKKSDNLFISHKKLLYLHPQKQT